jgi:hypothetical protein
LSEQTATHSSAGTDSNLGLRVLGVIAAAVLGVGTFTVLGVALMQTLSDRTVVGDGEGLEVLGYLIGGAIGGAAVGVAVSVWVGLRVWQSRWTLLIVLLGVAAVTGLTITLATR